MNITTEKLKQITKAIKPVAGRSMIPVTEYVFIECDDTVVRMTATNLQTTIVARAELDEPSDLRTTIRADKLATIAGLLPGEETTITADDDRTVTVQSGIARFDLHAVCADEFPPVPTILNGERFCVDRQKFVDIVSKCEHAICTDAARANICSVRLIVDGMNLYAVTTDGRRMCVAEAEVVQPTECAISVPRTPIVEAAKFSGDRVHIQFDDNIVSFSNDDNSMTIIGSLVSGAYPDYKQVIPKKHPICIRVDDTSALLESVRRASVMCDEKHALTIDVSENGYALSIANGEVGAYTEAVEAEVSGGVCSICCNPDYLMDALRHCDHIVNLRLKDEMSPIYITSGDTDFVIMPVRMN